MQPKAARWISCSVVPDGNANPKMTRRHKGKELGLIIANFSLKKTSTFFKTSVVICIENTFGGASDWTPMADSDLLIPDLESHLQRFKFWIPALLCSRLHILFGCAGTVFATWHYAASPRICCQLLQAIEIFKIWRILRNRKNMKTLILLLVALCATSSLADRILVLVDTLNTRETHSIFFKSLTGKKFSRWLFLGLFGGF